jgi:hypothetical protein
LYNLFLVLPLLSRHPSEQHFGQPTSGRRSLGETKARMDRAAGKSARMDRGDSDGPSHPGALQVRPVRQHEQVHRPVSTGCIVQPCTVLDLESSFGLCPPVSLRPGGSHRSAFALLYHFDQGAGWHSSAACPKLSSRPPPAAPPSPSFAGWAPIAFKVLLHSY